MEALKFNSALTGHELLSGASVPATEANVPRGPLGLDLDGVR